MARNRKRAKERRNRRPQPADGRVALARGSRDEHLAVPPPIEHATPDVELAEAEEREGELQAYASGIPGLYPDQPHVVGAPDELEEPDRPGGGGRGGRGRRGNGSFGGEGDGGGGELAPAGASVPEPRTFPGSRLVNFLRGSWRELQRVQWPDRRQVVQATGVVIGFVIVAGLFLGASDWVASKLITFVLK